MARNNERLSKELEPLCKNLTDAVSGLGSSGGRESVISAAKAIIHAAQDAQELYVHFAVNKCEIIVMRLFLKWEVFQGIPLQGSISFSELAAKIGAEVGLIARLSRMLIASGMLSLAGKDQVAHTHRSRMIAEDPLFRSTAKLILYEDFPQAAGTPEYFEHYGRREPAGKAHTPYGFRKGQPEKTVFELMGEQPQLVQIFMEAMVRTQEFLSTSHYDVSWIVAAENDDDDGDDNDDDDDDDDRPLLVDVGGGAGQALRDILSRTPGLPRERCVLQDRAEVIERNKKTGGGDPELSGVRMMAVDFHQEQPIKGTLTLHYLFQSLSLCARAYLIRRCLHDYGDKECAGILRQIEGAMDNDSRLLIMEMVLLPDSPPFCYAMDMAMMGIAGKERTLDDWEALTAEAGLKISKVVPAHGIGLSVLECVKG
ncbi:hypothetical protein MFIFM68171_02923 [Madurella fahalii]|uniref:O-methyltransferase C-terminal domain-containing protein n=1 Tax=Madurella fahalii TaxID=1157608 RepID=A0ABQ0G4M6_9PEZI